MSTPATVDGGAQDGECHGHAGRDPALGAVAHGVVGGMADRQPASGLADVGRSARPAGPATSGSGRSAHGPAERPDAPSGHRDAVGPALPQSFRRLAVHWLCASILLLLARSQAKAMNATV